jgi:hypothetical protein
MTTNSQLPMVLGFGKQKSKVKIENHHDLLMIIPRIAYRALAHQQDAPP